MQVPESHLYGQYFDHVVHRENIGIIRIIHIRYTHHHGQSSDHLSLPPMLTVILKIHTIFPQSFVKIRSHDSLLQNLLIPGVEKVTIGRDGEANKGQGHCVLVEENVGMRAAKQTHIHTYIVNYRAPPYAFAGVGLQNKPTHTHIT